MAKHDAQFNLFGGTGKVSEEVLVRSAPGGTTMGFVKCSACKQASRALDLPNALLRGDRSDGPHDSPRALAWALAQLRWKNGVCQDCEKAA